MMAMGRWPVAEPLIYEICQAGRRAVSLPDCDVPKAPLPAGCERTDLPLPEVAEIDLMRHYVRLSQMNYGIDTGFYPLGSCTMKYNPKVNEVAARIPGFAALHPLQPESSVQGAMTLMFELQAMLAEIAGFAAVTLQPAAGAHGELTGVLIMRKYLYDQGECERDTILVPDSAHGTNPATTSMSGFRGGGSAIGRARERRSRRAARADRPARPEADRPDADQPEHARPVRRERAGGAPAGARGGRAGLRRRRQLQRDPGHRQAGRPRLRRDALQPAQDLLDAARRRRAGIGRGGGVREAGRLPAGADRGAAASRTGCCTGRMPAEVDRPGEVVLRQLRHPGARLHLHPHARRGRGCGR